MTEHCQVISSSGVHIAYEAGVLTGLVKNSNHADTAWKHIYGTLEGALLAAFVCMFRMGEEIEAVKALSDLVKHFCSESGTRSYFPFGHVQGLVWNKALYDPCFLKALIKQWIDPMCIRDSGRHLYIVAVDYVTSEPRLYTEEDWEIIHEAIVASCSILVVFPPHAVPDACSPSGRSYFGDGDD